MSTPTIDVRRADERPHTRIGWLDSHHSFSFGPHWDPDNTGHGLLLVSQLLALLLLLLGLGGLLVERGQLGVDLLQPRRGLGDGRRHLRQLLGVGLLGDLRGERGRVRRE